MNSLQKPSHSIAMLDIRHDFPTLEKRDVAFFDTAASAQKPRAVIDAMAHVMADHYANIHRGLYDYSQQTTAEFEAVRGKVQRFINAPSSNEIIFTRNATESINLIAQSWGRMALQAGDEVMISAMEHHANIVPWQLLRDQIGITLKIIPVTDEGELDYIAFESLLSDKTKLISVTHTSNSLGTVNDVTRIVQTTKHHNDDIKILIDGSQGVVHGVTDIQVLGCDFFVFTGHKLYGPSGVGVLWGREELLNAMPPYQGGGDMIETVSFDHTTYKSAPSRFEAGTPAIVEVIGLGAAIDYVSAIGMEAIAAHEAFLFDHLMSQWPKDCRIIGTASHKAPIISFVMDGVHHSDIGMILNQAGVAVRTGHHCCMPLMERFGIDGTVRVSLGAYNNMNDIEQFFVGMDKVRRLLT